MHEFAVVWYVKFTSFANPAMAVKKFTVSCSCDRAGCAVVWVESWTEASADFVNCYEWSSLVLHRVWDRWHC